MKLRTFLDSQSSFRFFVERLNISSSHARNVLLDTQFPDTLKEIKSAYQSLKTFYDQFIKEGKFKYTILNVQEKLSEVRDIRGSLSRLEKGNLLDDIELFEIKSISLISEDIKHIFNETGINTEYLHFSDLSPVVEILDPEGNRINSFYVYDAYSEELALIRKELKSKEVFDAELYYKASLIEEKVRERLCADLIKYVELIGDSLKTLANLDIIIAKALQVKELNLCFPDYSKGTINYKALFNPEIEEYLSKEGKVFQPVDISIETQKPLLITGANMGGKSVSLKSLFTAQLLFQFSFGIPAKNASISYVDNLFLITGDNQSISKGLSSFAAEIIAIDSVIKEVVSGKKILALIDEPAGTTNPTEGTALVSSLLKRLSGQCSYVVITTHYNIENSECRRLRVRGYIDGKMDYSLIPVNEIEAPREAVNIARSLNVDDIWINEAELIVNQKNKYAK